MCFLEHLPKQYLGFEYGCLGLICAGVDCVPASSTNCLFSGLLLVYHFLDWGNFQPFCHWQMHLRPHCCRIVKSLFNHKKRNPQWRSLSSAAMRLVQFRRLDDGGGIRVGVEQGEGLGVVDLKAFDPSMPSTMKELLELGDKGLECAERCFK